MNIIAFGASSSVQSINKQLAAHAADALKAKLAPSATVEVLDLNDFEMPIYSIDREVRDGIPAQAEAFFKKLGGADAIIISFAEHNGTYSAAYKNIFDWASRINSKVFQNKPMLLMSTSPGGGGAKSVLESAVASAPFFDGVVRASLSVPDFQTVFDVDKGEITDSAIAEKMRVALTSLLNGQ